MWYHYIYHRNDKSVVEGPYRALYDGLKGDWASKLYSPTFLLRRLVLAIVLVYIRIAAVQISTAVVLQVGAIAYILIVAPFQSKKDNLMCVVNEVAILVVMIMFLTMRRDSNLSDDEVENRTQIAIWILCVAGIFAVVLSLILAVSQFYKSYQKFKKDKANKIHIDFNNAKSQIIDHSIEGKVDRGFESARKDIRDHRDFLTHSKQSILGMKIYKSEDICNIQEEEKSYRDKDEVCPFDVPPNPGPIKSDSGNSWHIDQSDSQNV